MSYQLTVSAYQAHLVSEDNFPCLPSVSKFTLCKDSVYQAHSDIEGILAEKSVKRAHSINKRKLNIASANRVHSIAN